LSPTTNQNGAHGTRSHQPTWSHDLCLLLIAQVLGLPSWRWRVKSPFTQAMGGHLLLYTAYY